jgi:hypothetical protein
VFLPKALDIYTLSLIHHWAATLCAISTANTISSSVFSLLIKFPSVCRSNSLTGINERQEKVEKVDESAEHYFSPFLHIKQKERQDIICWGLLKTPDQREFEMRLGVDNGSSGV